MIQMEVRLKSVYALDGAAISVSARPASCQQTDLKTSQDRSRAYALRTWLLKRERVMRRHQRFILKSGVAQLQQDTGFLHAQAKMNGES